MELARLILNLGNAGVRRDIADPYQMHSTLARAFAPDSHSAPDKFLWRLEDSRPDQPPMLLVQSESGGRWQDFERDNPAWILRRDCRNWEPATVLLPDMTVQFRIRCNPTVTRAGKRLGLWTENEQRAWLGRQGDQHGLVDLALSRVTSQRLVGQRRKGAGHQVVVCAVQFEGTAKVADAVALANAVRNGIGHAKMMGLGLISLAPLA